MAISLDNSRLYKSAQEAIRVRDDFLSIASHELKTPLTRLQLHIQAMQRTLSSHAEGLSTPRALAKLDTISRQVDRLERLVDSLLDIARITGKRLDIVCEEVDLAEVVREVISRLSGEVKNTGCSFELDAPEQLVGCWDRLGSFEWSPTSSGMR